MPLLLLPLQLETIANDINRAIDARLYYPALLSALTLPEICSALAMDRMQFVKERHYVAFIDTYSSPSELGLGGLDCFRLRGGVVHRADFRGHPYFDATHVLFTTPESGSSMHGFTIGNGEKSAAMFDLKTFCDAMITAARRWFQDNQNDPKVTENLKNLISFRPNGVSPFVVGLPVVASGE